jgi:hypothetical protein
VLGGIPALIALFVSCCFAAASGLLAVREITLVNEQLPPGHRRPLFFLYPGRMLKVKAAYHQMFPQGRLDRWRVVFAVTAFVFLAFAALLAEF